MTTVDELEQSPEPNACSFKKVCKNCKAADKEDRPFLCVNLKCPDYTPCKKCRMNRTLDPSGICGVCAKNKRMMEVTSADGRVLEVPVQQVTNFQLQDIDSSDVPAQREITITRPGVAPREYTQEEKEYYEAQWNEYVKFYRDPTAKALCHNIIILEIELNWMSQWLVNNRGTTVVKEKELQRNRIIRNLSELRNQLPQKEANDESDDERFVSMIYERYIEEKGKRYVGKVARILTPEAIALAPTLHFPVSPQTLLQRLGYRTVDAVSACDHITLQELPNDPKAILEWMGFFLDERYALPLEMKAIVSEAELPDVELPEETIADNPTV